MDKDYNKISWDELAYEWNDTVITLRKKFHAPVGIRENYGICGFYDANPKKPNERCKVTTNVPSERFCKYCKFFKNIEEVKK